MIESAAWDRNGQCSVQSSGVQSWNGYWREEKI